MISVITGSSGFVGKNLVSYFEKSNKCTLSLSRQSLEQRDFNHIIEASSIIHLAGKAHDLKMVSSPDEYYNVNIC